jgi:hypothetical protein
VLSVVQSETILPIFSADTVVANSEHLKRTFQLIDERKESHFFCASSELSLSNKEMNTSSSLFEATSYNKNDSA